MTYVQQSLLQCETAKDTGTAAATLSQAQATCSVLANDDSADGCFAVYDDLCDGTGIFYHCNAAADVEAAPTGDTSCVYRRIDGNAVHFFRKQ